jgi:hypothetical protein
MKPAKSFSLVTIVIVVAAVLLPVTVRGDTSR